MLLRSDDNEIDDLLQSVGFPKFSDIFGNLPSLWEVFLNGIKLRELSEHRHQVPYAQIYSSLLISLHFIVFPSIPILILMLPVAIHHLYQFFIYSSSELPLSAHFGSITFSLASLFCCTSMAMAFGERNYSLNVSSISIGIFLQCFVLILLALPILFLWRYLEPDPYFSVPNLTLTRLKMRTALLRVRVLVNAGPEFKRMIERGLDENLTSDDIFEVKCGLRRVRKVFFQITENKVAHELEKIDEDQREYSQLYRILQMCYQGYLLSRAGENLGEVPSGA